MAGNQQRSKGRKQEMRALAALREQPRTTQQLADKLGLCRSSAAIYIARLHTEPRRIFICGHEERTGSPAPIFAVGSLPDVEYLPQSCPAPKTSAAERRAQVLALLAEKPRTAKELAPLMHAVFATASKYIRELRQPGSRQVYILKWRHPREVDPEAIHGGDWAPVYAVGDKPDAPKPVAETSGERHARLHKSKDYRKARNKERRERYQRDKVIKQHTKAGPHSIFAALGL